MRSIILLILYANIVYYVYVFIDIIITQKNCHASVCRNLFFQLKLHLTGNGLLSIHDRKILIGSNSWSVSILSTGVRQSFDVHYAFTIKLHPLYRCATKDDRKYEKEKNNIASCNMFPSCV